MRCLFNRLSAVLYIIVLAFLMWYSPDDVGIRNPIPSDFADYIAHFLVYLPFMAFGVAIWGRGLRRGLWFALGTLLVVALECGQGFLPYRGFDWYDMLIGELGLVCSYLLMLLWYRCRGRA